MLPLPPPPLPLPSLAPPPGLIASQNERMQATAEVPACARSSLRRRRRARLKGGGTTRGGGGGGVGVVSVAGSGSICRPISAARERGCDSFAHSRDLSGVLVAVEERIEAEKLRAERKREREKKERLSSLFAFLLFLIF